MSSATTTPDVAVPGIIPAALTDEDVGSSSGDSAVSKDVSDDDGDTAEDVDHEDAEEIQDSEMPTLIEPNGE